MAPNDYQVSFLEGGVVLFEFRDMKSMTNALEDVSTYVEGKTSIPRVGHNFTMQKYKDFCRQTMSCQKEKGKKKHKQSQQHTLYEVLHDYTQKGALYVVGCVAGDRLTKAHELRHARFFVDSSYKEYVFKIWYERLNDIQREHITGFLSRLGYPKHVIVDEFQAYMFTEKSNFFGIRLQHIVTI